MCHICHPWLSFACTREFKRGHETMYRVQVAQDPPKPSDHQTTTLLLPLSLVNFILLLFQMGHKSGTYVWKKKKSKSSIYRQNLKVNHTLRSWIRQKFFFYLRFVYVRLPRIKKASCSLCSKNNCSRWELFFFFKQTHH